MGMIIGNEAPKKDYEALPDGVTYGVCRGLFDLGTHYDEHFDKDKREIIILWEIPEYRAQYTTEEGEDVDMPRIVSKQYTASMNAKANLRKDVDSWRGKPLTEEEVAVFDLEELVGKSCQLQLSTKEGKTWTNINTIMAMPKGVGQIINEGPLWWFCFEDDSDLPEDTPDWIKKKITTSQEWQARNG